jgi:hypothetical protein
MRTTRWIGIIPLALVLTIGGALAAPAPAGQATAAADGIVLTKPERVGLSSETLKELDPAMQGIVDKKQLGFGLVLLPHDLLLRHDSNHNFPVPANRRRSFNTVACRGFRQRIRLGARSASGQ